METWKKNFRNLSSRKYLERYRKNRIKELKEEINGIIIGDKLSLKDVLTLNFHFITLRLLSKEQYMKLGKELKDPYVKAK